MAGHQKRYDDWKAEQAKGKQEAAMPGGLLPPMPAGPPPKRRRRKTTGPQQKQISHPWAYIVPWYEEIRRHTDHTMGVKRIQFGDIVHWRYLFEIETEPWEVDVILNLDGVWLSALPKEPEKRKK